MGGFPAPVHDERSGLLVFLDQQRTGLRNAVSGLARVDAVSAPSASEHSVLGLLKHAAHTERSWIDTMRGRHGARPDAPSYADTFRVGDGAKVALVGANGAGKTTLLRIVTGELTPHAGAVTRSGGLGVMRQAVGQGLGPDPDVADLLMSVSPARV